LGGSFMLVLLLLSAAFCSSQRAVRPSRTSSEGCRLFARQPPLCLTFSIEATAGRGWSAEEAIGKGRSRCCWVLLLVCSMFGRLGLGMCGCTLEQPCYVARTAASVACVEHRPGLGWMGGGLVPHLQALLPCLGDSGPEPHGVE
jgi:hypothetical protein